MQRQLISIYIVLLGILSPAFSHTSRNSYRVTEVIPAEILPFYETKALKMVEDFNSNLSILVGKTINPFDALNAEKAILNQFINNGSKGVFVDVSKLDKSMFQIERFQDYISKIKRLEWDEVEISSYQIKMLDHFKVNENGQYQAKVVFRYEFHYTKNNIKKKDITTKYVDVHLIPFPEKCGDPVQTCYYVLLGNITLVDF